MGTAAPSLSEFLALLAAELSRIRSANRRVFIQKILIPPYQSRLEWEYGADDLLLLGRLGIWGRET